MTETTALGAAMAAGSAEGVNVWDLSSVMSAATHGSASTPVATDIFHPTINAQGNLLIDRVTYLKAVRMNWMLEIYGSENTFVEL